ncbi:MAG: lipocalin family protein, partial [Christiangramia sp.]
MRNFILLASVLILASSCSKDEDPIKPVDLSIDTISGVWKLTDTYISPGGETTWQSVENGREYTFHPDGSFELSEGECLSGTYSIREGMIEFQCNTSESVPRSFYISEFTNSTMEISYIGCIEACIYRYQKQ